MPTRSNKSHEAPGAGTPAAALHRDALLDAMVAGCAVIVHADGEAVPAERDRALMLVCSNPLLSAYPPDAVLRALKAHERAFREDAPAARVAALRQVELLAHEPGWARQVLNACLTLTGADGEMQPREITAIKQVRDALGLSPDRLRARTRAAVLAALLLAGPALSGPALAGTVSRTAAPGGPHPVELAATGPFALDASADDAFREVVERLRAGVPPQPTGDPDHDFVHGAAATLRGTMELAQYVLHHGHDPELRRLARSAIAENQKQLARLSRWQARHGEKHVQ